MDDVNTQQNTAQILEEIQGAIMELVKEREDLQNEMSLIVKDIGSFENDTEENDQEKIMKEQDNLEKELDVNLNSLLIDFIDKKIIGKNRK